MLVQVIASVSLLQGMSPWAFGEYLSNLAERPVLIEWFGEQRVVRAAPDPELPLEKRIEILANQAGYDYELHDDWLALTPKRVRPDLRIFDNLMIWSREFKPPVGEWAKRENGVVSVKLAPGESVVLADLAHAMNFKLGLVAPCFPYSRLLLFGRFQGVQSALSGLGWLLAAKISQSDAGISVVPDGERMLKKRKLQAHAIVLTSTRADRITNSAELELHILDRVGPDNLEKLFMNWELEMLLDAEHGTPTASLLVERYRQLCEQLARQGQPPPELADPPRFQVLFSGKGHVSAQAEGKNGVRVVF
jgi:hypothetical protein